MASPNLFFGDLPQGIDDNMLMTVMGAYGTITSHKIFPPGPRGGVAAIVSFASVDEAKWIVENLNGNIPQGLTSPIRVSYKQDKGASKGQASAYPVPAPGAPPFGSEEAGDSVFVGDLPGHCDDNMVLQVFGPYGTIASHKLVNPGSSGKRACIITFASVDQATWLVQNLNGNIPQGLTEPITVKFKRNDPKGKGKGGADWGAWPAPAPGADPWQQDAGKGRGPATPSESIFVGDLPANMDSNGLLSVFGAYGNITSHKMLQPGSISGRMAAIITFATVPEAQWIVDNLNMNIPQGLTEPIKVRFKDNQAGGAGAGGVPPPAAGYGKAGGGYAAPYSAPYDAGKGAGKGSLARALVDGLFASGAMPGGTGADKMQNDAGTVFIGGLPYDTTDSDLYRLFTPFGAIKPYGVTAMQGDHSPCKGFGFVNFMDAMSAQAAINALHGTKMADGKELRLNIKKGSDGAGGMPFAAPMMDPAQVPVQVPAQIPAQVPAPVAPPAAF